MYDKLHSKSSLVRSFSRRRLSTAQYFLLFCFLMGFLLHSFTYCIVIVIPSVKYLSFYVAICYIHSPKTMTELKRSTALWMKIYLFVSHKVWRVSVGYTQNPIHTQVILTCPWYKYILVMYNTLKI